MTYSTRLHRITPLRGDPPMRSIFAAATVLFAASLFTGCAAQVDPSIGTDEEAVDESSDALSAYGQKLVGSYRLGAGFSFEFDALVLKSDGTYFLHRNIYCITTPCPTREEGRFRGYRPPSGSVIG